MRGIEPRREGHGQRLAGRLHGMVQDAPGEGGLVEDPGEDRCDVGGSVRAHGRRPLGEYKHLFYSCGRIQLHPARCSETIVRAQCQLVWHGDHVAAGRAGTLGPCNRLHSAS